MEEYVLVNYVMESDERLATIIGIALLAFFVTGCVLTLIDIVNRDKK